MKPRELSPQELQETCGGADSSGSSFGLSSSTDCLLSLNYEWQQGDRSHQWNLEVGKNVHADVNLLNNKTD